MSFKNRWTISSSYDFKLHQQWSQRRSHLSQMLYSDSRCSQVCCRQSKTCPQRSQTCRQHSQACRRPSQVLPRSPNVLSSALMGPQTHHNHSHGTPVPVIGDPSYSECRPECPPRVWYSPEIDPSKFTLHILSDTPGGFQWLKYILLMRCISKLAQWWPAIASLILPKHGAQVNLRIHIPITSEYICKLPKLLSWGAHPIGLMNYMQPV